MLKTVNNNVSIKLNSSCKIYDKFDESGKIMSGLKRVTDLMNKSVVTIADKMLIKRKDAFHNNREFCLSSVCSNFAFKKLTTSQIKMYIRNIRQNKSVRSDVTSNRFVKLNA